MVLQPADLAAERRLADVEAPGRPAEVQFLGQHEQQPQLMHTRITAARLTAHTPHGINQGAGRITGRFRPGALRPTMETGHPDRAVAR
ncbi:hypothetical protein GCM10010393_26800 [Streptomyces gobitricini]|uniref:Uncharacterized protein n=1 Tax=Streptomyces gobitricini TaxID=68211 RepID=A0ABN3M487_9ACTN